MTPLEKLRARVGTDAPEQCAIFAGVITRAKVDRKARTVQGMVSTEGKAMDGMVWLPRQFDYSYFPGKVRAVYLNHEYTMPVGMCRNMTTKGDGVFATTYITRNPIGDEIMTLIEEEALNGKSLGIRMLDWGPMTPDEKLEHGDAEGGICRKAKVLEYSLTAMPSDPDALIEVMSRSLVRRQTAVLLGLPDTPVRKFFPVHGPARVERFAPIG